MTASSKMALVGIAVCAVVTAVVSSDKVASGNIGKVGSEVVEFGI